MQVAHLKKHEKSVLDALAVVFQRNQIINSVN